MGGQISISGENRQHSGWQNDASDSALAPLDIAAAARSLADCAVGHTLRYHEVVASTMPLAQELALCPETPSGTVVIAEVQHAGRGRLDRRWLTPARQALLMSIALKPPHLPATPGHLPMLAGVAVVAALRTLTASDDLQVGLKWPNDILLRKTRGQPAKVGGVLIESTFAAGVWQAAVVGIGVNVNQLSADLPPVTAPALPPTSLRMELGRALDRTALLVALCRAWEQALSLAPTSLVETWRSQLWTLGQPVSLYRNDRVVLEGVALDVQEDGALVIEDENGRRNVVTAGDVSLRVRK